MDAGPARRRSAGFSLTELLLTLLVLGLAAWLVLRLVDRRTRLTVPDEPGSGPDAAADAALKAVGRDVRLAGTGGLSADEAFRAVADNTRGNPDPKAFRTADGAWVVPRPGTDQLGLRGVIRSPLVPIEPGAASGALVSERPAAFALRVAAPSGAAAVKTRLAEDPPGARPLFLLEDGAGHWALGRVVSAQDAPGGAGLDLVLDFTDEDARARGPRGDPGAAARLGAVRAGGVFDDLVWFVARGAAGTPPDFDPRVDPPSLEFPHPYLACAQSVGAGLVAVRRAVEEVEDLQVAYGLAGPLGEVSWRAAVPGSTPPSPAELVDASGKPLLSALRLAAVAKSPQRLLRSAGAPPPDVLRLLNAPEPGAFAGAGPIGWRPGRAVDFDREARESVVPASALSSAPR